MSTQIAGCMYMDADRGWSMHPHYRSPFTPKMCYQPSIALYLFYHQKFAEGCQRKITTTQCAEAACCDAESARQSHIDVVILHRAILHIRHWAQKKKKTK